MPPQLSSATAGLKKVLAGFTAGQKAVTALALVGMVIAGVVFTSWASKPALVPLFTNLAAADGAAITEELNSRGTKYQLAEGGGTVLVPQKDVYQLRLDLSAAGLPGESKAGYALLDKQGITTSEFRQRVDFQRALEGELSKTITSIEGVEASTVHLVIPEQALFSEDARQPSASVLVKTKTGVVLTPQQVQAVVNLVSSSVEGLEPGKVTLADAKGNVLSGSGEDGQSLAMTDTRAMQTQAFEGELQSSVQDMLMPVVGAGKAVVRVKATLDFDKRETVTQTFGKEEAPAVSESTATETYEGTQQIVGGVLGPENDPNALNGGENNYEKGQTTRTNAVDKVTETAVSAPGKVERLTVAVLLDERAAGVVNPQQVQALVAAATGLDPARGDVVEVSRMPFDDTAEKAAEEEFAKLEAAEKSKQRWALGRTVAILLVVGLLLLHALRVMRRDRRTPVELPVLELESGAAAQLAAIESERAAMLEAQQRLALEPAEIDQDELKRLAVQDEIGELVERQPEEVALLLRGWLADRRN